MNCLLDAALLTSYSAPVRNVSSYNAVTVLHLHLFVTPLDVGLHLSLGLVDRNQLRGCRYLNKLFGDTHELTKNTGTNASFDYIVVGGGTAGLAIATRLAQHASFSVAVIEAGGFNELENSNLSQVPAFALNSAGQDTTMVDWRFETTP